MLVTRREVPPHLTLLPPHLLPAALVTPPPCWCGNKPGAMIKGEKKRKGKLKEGKRMKKENKEEKKGRKK